MEFTSLHEMQDFLSPVVRWNGRVEILRASDLEGGWVADAAPAGGEHAQRKDCSDAGKGDGAGDYPDDG